MKVIKPQTLSNQTISMAWKKKYNTEKKLNEKPNFKFFHN